MGKAEPRGFGDGVESMPGVLGAGAEMDLGAFGMGSSKDFNSAAALFLLHHHLCPLSDIPRSHRTCRVV